MNKRLTFNTEMRKINTANTKKQDTNSLSKTKQVNNNTNHMNMTSNMPSKRNKDDFFVFSNKKEYFGFDNERLKEEILKLKKENNKKMKEIDILKAEIKVHSQESKKQMKVIEDILLSSGKSFDEVTSIFDGSKKVENIKIDANSVIKLREVYVINFLKSQVGQLKVLLHEKEEEIGKLTENIKVTKLIQLENDLKTVKSENEMLKNELLRKVGLIEEKELFLKDNQQEHVLLYKKYIKKEIEYEKIMNSLLKVEKERKVLLEENKKITENSNRIKLNMINMKADVKYKSEVGLSEKTVDEENESLNRKVNELKKENSRLKVDMK